MRSGGNNFANLSGHRVTNTTESASPTIIQLDGVIIEPWNGREKWRGNLLQTTNRWKVSLRRS